MGRVGVGIRVGLGLMLEFGVRLEVGGWGVRVRVRVRVRLPPTFQKQQAKNRCLYLVTLKLSDHFFVRTLC